VARFRWESVLIVSFLLTILLCNTVTAADDYPVNFIVPEGATPTPTPQQESSNNGGSRWSGSSVVPVSANPPEVLLKIKETKPAKSIFELIIANEGETPWEYIYTWTLNNINETTGNYTKINSWRSSKYLKPDESSSIPIIFGTLPPGKYRLSAEVDYGGYVSKAHTEFEITAQQVQIGKAVNQWGIWLVLIAIVGFLGLLYMDNRKQQKALNKIIKRR
jgi:hypothetical protein